MRIVTSARDGGWQSGKTFKLDPRRVLFTLRHEHNAISPDFELLLYKDSRQWFAAVATSLFAEPASVWSVGE